MTSDLIAICKDAIFTLLDMIKSSSTDIGSFEIEFRAAAEEALSAYLNRLEQAGWPPEPWEHGQLDAVMRAMECGEYATAYGMLSNPVYNVAVDETDVPPVAIYRARLELLRRTPIAKQ